MKRIAVLSAVAMVAAIIPASASAVGTTCSYTSTQTQLVSAGGVVVYEGSGMSGEATAAVGACAYAPTDLGPAGSFAGGTVEVGVGTPAGGPGAYAIVDGDNANADALGYSDGYIGVSNFETSPPKGGCDTGTGTNSGGCIGIKPAGIETPAALAPVLIVACGNTSGNTWASAGRDGCAVP